MTTLGPDGQPDVVRISRSGGFAGMVRTWELNLHEDPEARRLLLDTNLLGPGETHPATAGGPSAGGPSAGAAAGGPGRQAPGPDRFTYAIQWGERVLRVPEGQLSPDVARLIQIVRERGAPPAG